MPGIAADCVALLLTVEAVVVEGLPSVDVSASIMTVLGGVALELPESPIIVETFAGFPPSITSAIYNADRKSVV